MHYRQLPESVFLHITENNTVNRVIADGAYDSKENFQYLSDKHIEADIKVRKNSTCDKSKEVCCYPRKK